MHAGFLHVSMHVLQRKAPLLQGARKGLRVLWAGLIGSGLVSPGTAGLLVAVEASSGPAGLCFMWLCQQFNCHASTISITSSDETIGRSDSAWGQGCGCVDE